MGEEEIKESPGELRTQAHRAEKINQGHSLATPGSWIMARPVRKYRALLFQGYILVVTLGFAVLFFLRGATPISPLI